MPSCWGVHVGGHRGHSGRELPHHLFEDVPRSDQPLDVAVLVHHEGHPLLPGLKGAELHVERRPEGREVGLPGGRGQDFEVELAARDRVDHPAQVNHPFDRIDVAPIDRQLGMGAGEDGLLERPFTVIEVKARDLVLRHHDVVHRDLLEVQQAHQHGAVAIRHPNACLAHHRAELLRAQPFLAALGDAHAQQPQQPVGQPVHGAHQGVGEP